MSDKDGSFRFISDADIVFVVDFMADDLIVSGNTFQLIIGNIGNKKSPRDYKVRASGLGKLFTTMTSVLKDEEGVENTATLIIRNDNPDFDLLVSEYSKTVKFLSQKPNDL